MMSDRRVVITGLGCVTALAESADGLFEALCRGQSGISSIESFDTSEFSVHFGGEIKTFNVDKYVSAREGKRMDRFTQMALASAMQAVQDSGLDFESEDKDRAGVIIGTGIGGIKEIEEQYLRLLEKGCSPVHQSLCWVGCTQPKHRRPYLRGPSAQSWPSRRNTTPTGNIRHRWKLDLWSKQYQIA